MNEGKAPRDEPSTRDEVEYTDATARPTVVAREPDYPMASLTTLFDSTFSALFPALAERGITPVGAPFALYHRAPDTTVDIEVGIPVESALPEPITVGDVVLSPSTLPAGTVASTSYVGPYDGLGEAWGAFMRAIGDAGRNPALPFWEVYVTEPDPDMDPSTLRTDLFILVTGGVDEGMPPTR